MQSLSTNQQFWQHHIDTWQASGLSGPAFCQQYDLVYHRFSYWRRKLTQAESDSAFSQVVCSTGQVASFGLSLLLPNGIEVRGVELHNLPVVHALLERL
jgi:hypothetical protein